MDERTIGLVILAVAVIGLAALAVYALVNRGGRNVDGGWDRR